MNKNKVKIDVDFGTVWAFLWRLMVLYLGIAFIFGLIVNIFN